MATTWNPSDKGSNFSLSNGNLTATKSSSGYQSVRATDSYSGSGKYYFEITIDSSSDEGVGLANGSASMSNYLGVDGNSWGYYKGGGTGLGTGMPGGLTSYTNGDIISFAVDFDSGKFWFAKNNTWQNGTPGTGGVSFSGTIFPAFTAAANGVACTANFGSTTFAYTPPSGYAAWTPVEDVEGPLAVTDTQDTFAASGVAQFVTGTLAATEAPDTFAATGQAALDTTTYWNSSDKGSNIDLSNSNLTATFTPSGAYRSVRANRSRSSGKYYFELTADTALGLGIGVMLASSTISGFVGQDSGGWGFYAGGQVFTNNSGSGSVLPWADGDIIGVAVDLDANKIWFSVNGVYRDGDPVAGTSPTFSSLDSGSLFPTISGNVVGVGTANFGYTELQYLPSGFTPWHEITDVIGNIGAVDTQDVPSIRGSYPSYGDLVVSDTPDVSNIEGEAVNSAETIMAACGVTGQIITSLDGVTWTQQITGTTRQLNSIVQGGSGGTWVCVGILGTILTSPDTIVWTARSSPTTDTLTTVEYGDGLFVAVSSAGKIITSPDGITWTLRTSGTTLSLQAVGYGNGLWVVAGASGVLRTSTDGLTWTTQTSITPSSSIRDVLYSDAESLWIAVGVSAHRVFSSTDGITWTVRNSPTYAPYSVTYSVADDLFVTSGASRSILYSDNGTSWSYNGTLFAAGNLFGIDNDGSQYITVGVGTGSATLIYTSADALTWTQRTSPVTGILNDIYVGDFLVPPVADVYGQLSASEAQDTFAGTGNSTVTNNVIARFELTDNQDTFNQVFVSTTVSGDMNTEEQQDVAAFSQGVTALALKILPNTLDAFANLGASIFDGGLLYIYSGSQPIEPTDPPAGTLLATVQLPDPAFAEAEDGVAEKTGTWEGVATDTGIAGWFRLVSEDEENSIDGSVTTTLGDGNMQTSTQGFTIGDPVVVTSCTFGFTFPEEE